jgi:hypothetical protein
MTAPFVVTCALPLRPRQPGRRQPAKATTSQHSTPGRVPRVARLMALAIQFDGLLRQRVVRDYAALARLGHVSRARISQIMNLLFLAPDIQEELLFLPPVERGRDPVHLRQLQHIAMVQKWPKQRRLWQQVKSDIALRLACLTPLVTPGPCQTHV